MTPGRKAFAEMVMDPNNSPIKLIGAAVSYARMNGNEMERRVAAAVEAAIKDICRPSTPVTGKEGS